MRSYLHFPIIAAIGVSIFGVAVPARAASADNCESYASGVANDYNRGLVGNAVTLPLDVAGAVLTGKTTHDGERQRVFDEAFAECMSGDRVVVTEPDDD